MKQLFNTDYVLWDKANDSLYQDSYGRIIIFGDKKEAEEDCCGNEYVTSCTDLPKNHYEILIKQINN
jgi:hypothetical protein